MLKVCGHKDAIVQIALTVEQDRVSIPIDNLLTNKTFKEFIPQTVNESEGFMLPSIDGRQPGMWTATNIQRRRCKYLQDGKSCSHPDVKNGKGCRFIELKLSDEELYNQEALGVSDNALVKKFLNSNLKMGDLLDGGQINRPIRDALRILGKYDPGIDTLAPDHWDNIENMSRDMIALTALNARIGWIAGSAQGIRAKAETDKKIGSSMIMAHIRDSFRDGRRTGKYTDTFARELVRTSPKYKELADSRDHAEQVASQMSFFSEGIIQMVNALKHRIKDLRMELTNANIN